MSPKNGSTTVNSNGHSKTFVIDTNVLLHNPDAIFVFEENEIVIPFDVLEELDHFKTGNDDVARNAREAIRHLDRLRVLGNIAEGIKIPETGGTLRVAIDDSMRSCPKLAGNTPDNRIICVAYNLAHGSNGHSKRPVVFVSKDINARIKSDALGIKTEDFENQKVDFDKLYTGYRELVVSGDVIDELFKSKEARLVDVEGDPLRNNEFVLLKDINNEGHTALTRYKADIDRLMPLRGRKGPVFGIMARNLQQTMALDLLLDDSVKLVSLIGSAGTGKTLLALAAGMTKVLNEESYVKLLCARPIMPMGRDIGYLPGDKDEKLSAWMQPIFDNVAYLLSNKLNEKSDASNHGQHSTVEQRIEQLINQGKLVLEPLTYIRGRSIPNQFMIVDEAQNLTPHEV
ncbi:MAG TPA: PIN domain-containing protein, partial [Tepidisphaeraceae bacterium]|nr:PIN domain-containing protein [Tepidisphaeraceae bacterium]